MRTQVAILLLVCIASCSAVVSIGDVLSGLAVGINRSDLADKTVAIQNLNTQYVLNLQALVQAVEAQNVTQAAALIRVVGENLGDIVLALSDVQGEVSEVVQYYVQAAEQLSVSTLESNIYSNLGAVLADQANIQKAIENDDGKLLGNTLANLLNVAVLGKTTAPARAVRILDDINNGSSSLITDVVDVVIAIQGFFETANTTVDVNVYEGAFNDGTYMALLISPLINDIKSGNISALIHDVPALIAQFEVVETDGVNLKNQLVQWAIRDLSLVQDHGRVARAALTLIGQVSALQAGVQAVEAAYVKGDPESAGKASGALYNILFSALSA